MKIGINVSFVRKRGAGIGEVTYHFLTELVQQVAAGTVPANVQFVLYAEESLVLDVLDAADNDVRARFDVRVFVPPYTRDDLIRKIWWERYSLPRAVRRDGCDVFLSLYQCPTVFTASFFGRSLRGVKRRGNRGLDAHSGLLRFDRNDGTGGMKHVMLVHDLVPRLFPAYTDNVRKRLYQWLSERAIVRADRVLTVSKHTEKDVIRELNVAPEKVATHYIDCDPVFKNHVAHGHAHNHADVLAHYDLAPGYIYFGGGLDVRKNAERLLRAYKQLLVWRKDGMLAHDVPPLVISGKLMPQLAPLITDVAALVKELNLTQYVRVLGFVPQEHLPALYGEAVLFVYPSLYEGFGLPVLEALAMGAPVVASTASSIPEVGGDAVIYCNPRDVEDIALSMRKVLTDMHVRQQIVARGPERAAHFSWAKFVREVIGVLTA